MVGFWYFSMYVFLFFKQKTAYEMRISDWSSDVVLFRSIGGQGAGDLDPAPLAARQAGADLPGHVADLQLVHQAGQLALPRVAVEVLAQLQHQADVDRKSTRLNSSH